MIYLCSTSPYRQSLLEKLHLSFRTVSPEVDETALTDEAPETLIKRLSIAKAVAGMHKTLRANKDNHINISDPSTNDVFIGSDQMALCNGQLLGKPGNAENAIKQLSLLSGQSVIFLTGLAVVKRDETVHYDFDVTTVDMRSLSIEEIEHYVKTEEPFGSAGSFKSEGYGISLFKSIETTDPNALIGLPLIKLCDALRQFDINVLNPS